MVTMVDITAATEDNGEIVLDPGDRRTGRVERCAATWCCSAPGSTRDAGLVRDLAGASASATSG